VLAADLARVTSCELLPNTILASGFLYDVATGLLHPA